MKEESKKCHLNGSRSATAGLENEIREPKNVGGLEKLKK